MSYTPATDRYHRMVYHRCGASGVRLPAISIGLWHNFGHDMRHDVKQAICRTAFDQGINHFDLANNYGLRPDRLKRHLAKFCAMISVACAMSC
jgi:L-glyceraldehyde 3-phosphate reductase